jgi:hypothetical protein
MAPRRAFAFGAPRLVPAFAGAVFAGAVLTAALPAAAQSNPEFYPPQRWFVCHGEDEKAAVPPPAKAAALPTGLLPLPRKHAPSPLEIAPLEVADVAVLEPIPARAPLPTAVAAAPPEKPVLVEGDNDFRCIGFPRGKAGILRVVGASYGARFAHHDNAVDWRLINYRAAGAVGLAEAIPALRREIERPVPPGPADYKTFDLLDAKLHAMRALGDLGDRESAPRVAAFLRTREDESYSLIWRDSLAPLARLDPAVAQSYAIAAIRRVTSGSRHPTDENAMDGDSLVRDVLPLLTQRSAADLAALQQVTADTEGHSSHWHDACEVLAARIRLGDDALRKEMRAELSTDLRTNRATVCYSQLMPFAFPGDDPDEVDTLLFRHRYTELLNLLEKARRLAKTGPLEARWKEGQKKILEWLKKQSAEPEIAGGKSDTRYRPDHHALHLTALAVLGDAAAKAALDKLIEDPAEEGAWPWIAAEQALRFDLDGAADHTEKRLRLAIDHHTVRYDTDLDPCRGPLLVNDHVRVIDALAARGDARFALGLLDEERWAREAAAVHLAKLKPAAACELVGNSAKLAVSNALTGQPVEDSFWVLSLLGDACRPTMWKLLHDAAQPAAVRGMALEHLAMTRDPRIESLLDSAEKRDDLRDFRKRAKIIFFAKE